MFLSALKPKAVVTSVVLLLKVNSESVSLLVYVGALVCLCG